MPSTEEHTLNPKGIVCVCLLIIILAPSTAILVNLSIKSSVASPNRDVNIVQPDLQTPQVTEHKVTSAELAQLENDEGVFEADASPATPADGLGGDAHPPTAQEWASIAPDAYLVASITSPCVVPASVDNSQTPWFPPIGVQNHGCNAFSVAYYTKTFQEAKEHGWDLSGARWQGFSSGSYGYPTASYQNEIMSPAFVYNLDDPSGSIESTISLVCNIGDCTWAAMPYDGNNWTGWPSEAAWTQAAYYRGNSTTNYQYIDLTTNAGLNNLKNWLANQNLASIYINASALTPSSLTPQDFLTLDNYSPSTASSTDHVNTIVGYDDTISYTENGSTHYGAFKIANSWGAGVYNWENIPDGFYWISYAAMEQRIKTCLFYNGMVGYQPTLTVSFKIVDDKRSDCTITVGVGSTTSPIATKSFSNFVSGYPYPYSPNDRLPFPGNNIVFDITEFENSLPTLSGQTFWLKVDDDGSAPGIIANFAVNSSIGYQASTNVPCPLVNHGSTIVYVTLPSSASFTVSPNLGPPGGAVILQAAGLTHSGTATLTYLNPQSNQWVTVANNVAISSSGAFIYSLNTPDLLRNNIAGDHTAGSDTIVFRVQDSGGLSYNSSVPYTEMARALLRVGNNFASKTYGNNTDLTATVSTSVGKSLSIAGCWFQPGTAALLWDNTAVSTGLLVDEDGGVSTTFTVPVSNAGAHVVTLQDGNAKLSVSVTVVPVPPLFAVANGVVYTYQSGTISATQASSGTQLWSITTAITPCCLAADNNAVYLGSTSGLTALSITSKTTLWTMTSAYYQNAFSLSVFGGAVYEGTTSGYFLGLDPNTGQIVGPDTGYYGSLPTATVAANGIVYLALWDGALRAYTVPGTIYWRSDTYSGTPWVSLALDNGLLYAGAGNQIYAFNASNGNLNWSNNVGTAGNVSLSAGNGQVYASLGSQIYALSESNGGIEWSETLSSAVSSPTAGSGVLFAAVGNQLEALTSSGTLSWSYQAGGTVSSFVVTNGLAYATSSDGDLTVVNTSNGQKVWDLLTEPSSTPSPSPSPTPTPTPTPSPTPAPTSSQTAPAASTSPTSAPQTSPSASPTATATPTKTTTATPTSTPIAELPNATVYLILAPIGITALVAASIVTLKKKQDSKRPTKKNLNGNDEAKL